MRETDAKLLRRQANPADDGDNTPAGYGKDLYIFYYIDAFRVSLEIAHQCEYNDCCTGATHHHKSKKFICEFNEGRALKGRSFSEATLPTSERSL